MSVHGVERPEVVTRRKVHMTRETSTAESEWGLHTRLEPKEGATQTVVRLGGQNVRFERQKAGFEKFKVPSSLACMD